jgi:hypothetical protein
MVQQKSRDSEATVAGRTVGCEGCATQAFVITLATGRRGGWLLLIAFRDTLTPSYLHTTMTVEPFLGTRAQRLFIATSQTIYLHFTPSLLTVPFLSLNS